MAQPFVDPCAKGVINAEPCPREQGRELPSGRRRIILAACVVASSMAFIDGSVLTVALPKLRTALGADLATVQWVINSYVLALAALTLVGGALADTYGKARILQIGCFLFGAVSAGCALSSSVGGLIAARALQGIADAGKSCADRRDLSQGGASGRDRRVGCCIVVDKRCRSCAWRLVDAAIRMAGGVLDQSSACGHRNCAAFQVRAGRSAGSTTL